MILQDVSTIYLESKYTAASSQKRLSTIVIKQWKNVLNKNYATSVLGRCWHEIQLNTVHTNWNSYQIQL